MLSRPEATHSWTEPRPGGGHRRTLASSSSKDKTAEADYEDRIIVHRPHSKSAWGRANVCDITAFRDAAGVAMALGDSERERSGRMTTQACRWPPPTSELRQTNCRNAEYVFRSSWSCGEMSDTKDRPPDEPAGASFDITRRRFEVSP